MLHLLIIIVEPLATAQQYFPNIPELFEGM